MNGEVNKRKAKTETQKKQEVQQRKEGFWSVGSREPLRRSDRANLLNILNKAPVEGVYWALMLPLPQMNLTHGNGTLQNKHLGNISSLRYPEIMPVRGIETKWKSQTRGRWRPFSAVIRGHGLRSCV